MKYFPLCLAFIMLLSSGLGLAEEGSPVAEGQLGFNPAPTITGIQEPEPTDADRLPEVVHRENVPKHEINPLLVPPAEKMGSYWPSTSMEVVTLQRPGTIEASTFQLDTTISVGIDKHQDLTKFELPLFLRAGLGNNTELQLGYSAFNWKGTNAGCGDANLGFKWNFFKSENDSAAAIIFLETPAGSPSFSDSGLEPGLTLSYSHTFGDEWGLVLNATLQRLVDGDTHNGWGKQSYGVQFFRGINHKQAFSLALSAKGPSDYQDGIYKMDTTLGYSFPVAHSRSVMSLYLTKGLSTSGCDWRGGFGVSTPF